MKRLRRWFRRILLIGLTVVVAVPLSILLLYRVVPPPITPLMVIRLTEGYELERRWVDWHRIAPHLRTAVVAAEDNLFCSHRGFDFESLKAAVAAYGAGEKGGGGSTISMQTTKNLLLWPSRSVLRKGLEIPLTAVLELLWPKQRILEVYLNVAEWGPGVYGVEAASQHYFGRSAMQITPRQAAQLAAVLPSPLRWRPTPPSAFIAGRTETILTRAQQLGAMLDCVRD